MLISIGKYFDFCDYNIIATPEEFLKYISDSKFVITDTFHGTIFSIIFKKEFVSVDIKNMKVNNLLNDYGLNERILTSSDDLESMYNKSVDYFKSENLLKDRIDFSKGFIEEMINKVVKR